MLIATKPVRMLAKYSNVTGRHVEVLPARPSPLARRVVITRASPSSDDLPGVMTLEKAYSILGVLPNASFEEVLSAKNRLLTRDRANAMEIETAYDVLFMQNMKKRLTGELEVSTSVRYADVPLPLKKGVASRSARPPASTRAPQLTLPKLPSSAALSVSVAAPRNSSVVATQAAVFGGLAVWALLQAMLESPDGQLSETAGLQLALALAYGIYSLKENKGMQLGKAVGCTMACLLGGALLGNIVEAWLRVDIVPVLGFASPGTLVAEFIIAACAAGAIFLV